MELPRPKDPIAALVAADDRYHRDAYAFLKEALEYTQRTLKRPVGEKTRHITGQELLEGIREYALKEYGPMALTVLSEWGIHRSEDFGEIVFNMVEHGILSKTENDSRKDFQDGYDFEKAFRSPFRPSSTRAL
ncbi:MAG: hypothetical protein EBU81_06500 [Proteobacteria bacterium]|jgi:uncharacterized repeat protein (TIGR04138 family)|nr:hypothetical protein [Pseudomonadota bacterium]